MRFNTIAIKAVLSLLTVAASTGQKERGNNRENISGLQLGKVQKGSAHGFQVVTSNVAQKEDPRVPRGLRKDPGNRDGSVVGLYVIGIEEGTKGTPATYTPYIELEDGTKYELQNLPDGFGADARSGRTYITLPQDAIFLEAEAAVDLGGHSPEITGEIEVNDLDITGRKSVLVVRVHLNDFQYDRDPGEIADEVFGDAGGTDTYNLSSGLSDCSYGDLSITKAEDRQGVTGAAIDNGVVTISVDRDSTDSDIENAVTDAINEEFEVDSPGNLATHVMYCFPTQALEGIAYGTPQISLSCSEVLIPCMCSRASHPPYISILL